MKFSGHTNATFGYGFEKTVELFSRLGFDGLDIGCNQCSGVTVSLTGQARKEIARLVSDSGLRVSCLASYVGGNEVHLGSVDTVKREEAIDKQKQHIDLASEIDVNLVRIFCGKDVVEEKEKEKCFALCVESLKKLAVYAKAAGITLLIENHPETLTVSAADTVKIIEAVDEENVRVLYDPSNLIVYAKDMDVEGNFTCQRNWIKHVHVKDQAIDKQGKYRNIVPGRGCIAWKKILALLNNINYQGYLTMEYQRGAASSKNLPDPEIGLKEGLRFLKELLKKIRREE